MHEGVRTGSITYSARTVGVGAGSHVTAAEQRPPHMFPRRSAGESTRYRSAAPGRAHDTAPQSCHPS